MHKIWHKKTWVVILHVINLVVPIKFNTMKKIYVFILLILTSYSVIADQPQKPSQGGEYIPIGPVYNPQRPRTPMEFDSYGVILFDELTITLSEDLGNADIVVTNTTTGESWYDGVNGVGATSIALSGDEGYYEIYIYTDCGDYSGTFII